MLREATSASSDDARLDLTDIESVPDDANLGAELRGAPPEVRLAAVRRSRRIPEPSTMRAAWASLPLDVRDRIGVMALTESFYSFTADRDPQAVTLEAARRCGQWHCEALNGITTAASAALPELYGTHEAEPLWAQRDGVAVVFSAKPAPADPTPMRLAIEAHRRALDKLRANSPYKGGNPDDAWLALDDAESQTFDALLAAPCANPADAEALIAHLRPLVGEEQRHPILNDMGDVACGVLAQVLDVFSAVLTGDAVAAGRLA